jgi:RNA polymerase sigma factor (sigma-70 family)
VTEGQNDADCITASWQDPAEFASIFERHSPVIYRYLYRSVGPAAAEDLMAEVFVTAFKSRTRYDPTHRDARPWLFGIAANLSRHHWRSERRSKQAFERLARRPLSDATFGTAEPEVPDEFEAVAKALSSLDHKFRQVLLLYADPGSSYEEIGVALGIPVGTVRSRLSRGRAQLRELLVRSGQLHYEAPERPQTISERTPPL